MHELSLCRSIYSIVDRARDGRPVESVHLQVGMLRQVVPDTLAYCWGLVTEETPLAGSRLDIDHVAIELRCRPCGCTTPAPSHLMLACTRCGSADVTVIRGEEFMVTSMDLRGRSDG